MSVIFQSGMLAGREFEVKYFHELNTKKGKKGRRFEIVPQEIDGETMPNDTYKPALTDKYAVFKCRLPKAYICDSTTKTGAEWDMFKQAVKYKYEKEDEKFTFTGTLDGIWAKKDWENIGGRLVVGGFILFSDPRFQPQGVKVRITSIQQFINNPHSPKITLSNATIEGSVRGTLKELLSQEVVIQEARKEAISYTKRRFRDAKETSEMLEKLIGKESDALEQQFTNGIAPINVQTMQMLVGDESLQFRYVNNDINPLPVEDGITYDEVNKQLHAPAKIVQHLTLGIRSISSSHAASEYKFWAVEEFKSSRLDAAEKKYYLYIKAPDIAQENAQYALTDIPLPFKGQTEYNLLVGVLNSEYEGARSFVALYGFTEILPSRITTEKVVSADGSSYFDMEHNAMKLGDVLDFNAQGDGKLKLKGTLVQSQSGEVSPLGCYRGAYNSKSTYYQGDEVSHSNGKVTSTYRKYSEEPTTGVPPTNDTHWQIVAQGAVGEDGKKGDKGENPSCVYRGIFDPKKEYYGNSVRLDCVKYEDQYYIAKITAGTFIGKDALPTDTGKWNEFGANFESVATNLLLTENANVAGWIFKNGIMQSESGKSWLNGKTGEMRMKGTLQQSTAYEGKYTDANIFSLPVLNSGEVREIDISSKADPSDIGKVIKLFNMSPRGGGRYEIGIHETISYNSNYSDLDDYRVFKLYPQEAIEFTCFELKNSNSEACYSWRVTNRYTTNEWQQQNCYGRFPKLIASAFVQSSNKRAFIQRGEYYDGSNINNKCNVERLDVGKYKISFVKPHKFSNNAYPMVCGCQNDGCMWACVNEIMDDYFIVRTGDDSSPNDANFIFMIFSSNWGYNTEWDNSNVSTTEITLDW